MRSIIMILLCAVMCSANVLAQSGPGGVGNSTSNTLWLKADDLTGYSAGDTITTAWPDASGNGNDASQSTLSYRPTYQTSNGVASVRFDGTDDMLDDSRTYNARTFFAIYNTSSSLMQTSDLGQLWGSYAESMHVAVDARSGGNNKGWSFDGLSSGGTSAKYALNGASYGSASAGNNNNPWEYDQWGLVSTQFSSTKGISRQVIGSLYPSFGVGSHQFGGDIAEIIVYDTNLNTSQKIIVENYLSSKYSLTLSQNDHYIFDATHKYEVAGIGRYSSGDEHTEASSADLLTVTAGAGLDTDGEFLLFGHDGGGTSTWSSSDAPTNMERLGQVWRFNETGDLGTVTFSIDTNNLTARSVGYDRLFLLVSSNSTLGTGATSYELVSVGAGVFAAEVDITDGDYVAIAALKPEVSFTTATSQGFENDVTDTIYIELNHVLDGDITVDYNVTGGTATGAGVDYTLPAGTATILSGESSTYIVIDLVDEVTLETTETVEITLSNPTSGISLGSTFVHTYSINDNDAGRDIEFTATSASSPESTDTITLTLQIDQIDLTQVTSVDYFVTSGTASGSGVDFTLASGTANIPAGDSTASITFTVVEDSLDEDDETLVISLTNPINANVGSNNTFTYTIQDNDAAPTVAFTQNTTNVDENIGTVNITVSLSNISAKPITVNYSLGTSTATYGVDFNLSGSSLSFAAGESSKTISITVIDDTDEENAENVPINLSSPSNASLGTISSHLLIINASDLLGTGGPSGVGSSSSNPLWLIADDITGISNGAAITTGWADASGNGNDASQSTASYQPTFLSNAVNGHASVRFDGTNDYLDDNNAYSARTLFIVYKTDTNYQDKSELAQLWGNYSEGVHVAPDPRTAQSTGGFSFDGDNSVTATARYAMQGDAYTGSFYANTSVSTWNYNEWTLVSVEFDQTYNISRQIIGSLVPQFTPGTHQFGGEIAEMIIYNTTLNNARKELVENYLAAKYDISIVTDLYDYESTHGNDVFGIGAETASVGHFFSESKEILSIGSASDLEANEYLLMGHNDATLDSFNTTAVAGISGMSILPRQWRASETGNVGSVTLTIDTTVLPTKPSGENQYLVIVDGDNIVSNGATVYHATYYNGFYQVEDIYLNEGNYVSIATASNVTVGTGNFSNNSTWATGTAPSSGETAIIAVGQTITLSGNSTIGDLFLSAGATLNASSNTMTIDEGTFIVGGTFNAGTGTVIYAATADQNIAALSYYNLTTDGSGTKTLAEDVTIQNDLTLTAGILDVGAGNYAIALSGDFNNVGGSLNARNGSIGFVGSTQQNISSNGVQFNNAVMNNTAGVLLNDNMEVAGQLSLVNGVVSTGSNRMYVSATGGSAIINFSQSSFIYGNLRRAVATDTDTYDFPVGNGIANSNYYPAALENNNLAGVSYIDVHFRPLSNHIDALLNVTSGALSLSYVDPTGVWRIDPDQQPSSGSYGVSLAIDQFSSLMDNDFIVVKRPSTSTTALDWGTGGGSYPADSAYGRMVSDGVAIVNGLTSFSEFGVGGGNGAALPIELLYFTAELSDNGTVDLDWATAIEIDNEYFTIERSENGVDFTEVLQVEGAGTTHETQYYHDVDGQPLEGTSYYRLKQTDFDGNSDYSDIAVVNNKAVKEIEVTIYPNPVSGQHLNIELSNADNNFIAHDAELSVTTIIIVDVLGRSVLQQHLHVTSKATVQLPSNMEVGTYFMLVEHNGVTTKTSFIYK